VSRVVEGLCERDCEAFAEVEDIFHFAPSLRLGLGTPDSTLVDSQW
jgi:hypothetical protein